MKIGIIGATGKAGSKITAEALHRGHQVTPLVRNAGKVTREDLDVIEKDLFDLKYADISDFDVLVNAFNAPAGREELHQTSIAHLISILKGHDLPRLIVVGGAGSLFVDKEQTTRLAETSDFPKAFKPTSQFMNEAFQLLQGTTDVKWTYLSPPAIFNPDGKRTGEYQIGQDNLLTNSEGDSEISYSDYAIALVDEIEKERFVGQRFTVSSK